MIMQVCEHCSETFQRKMIGRFCGKSCSAKWRMRQPEIRARIYTPERSAKASSTHKKNGKLLGRPSWNKGIPMREESRRKLCQSLKAIGHTFAKRGGNGQPPPKHQAMLHEMLGRGWIMEYAVALGGRLHGYPTCYKIDIANPKKMLAIECDGTSHSMLSRQAQDKKKNEKLRSLGWRVLRLKNTQIQSMCTTLNSKAVRTSLLKMF